MAVWCVSAHPDAGLTKTYEGALPRVRADRLVRCSGDDRVPVHGQRRTEDIVHRTIAGGQLCLLHERIDVHRIDSAAVGDGDRDLTVAQREPRPQRTSRGVARGQPAVAQPGPVPAEDDVGTVDTSTQIRP